MKAFNVGRKVKIVSDSRRLACVNGQTGTIRCITNDPNNILQGYVVSIQLTSRAGTTVRFEDIRAI